jgi:hypothetical protein
MPILSEADKLRYFPAVAQTGMELQGYLHLGQLYCESHYGANRPLEIQEHRFSVKLDRPTLELSLPLLPASGPLTLAIRSLDSSGWTELSADDYQFDNELGIVFLRHPHQRLRLTYTSGFYLDGSNQETTDGKMIKAICGQIVTWFANYKVGLDSYLNNPATGATESYNLTRPDVHLQTLLLPLRKYSPRSVGW